MLQVVLACLFSAGLLVRGTASVLTWARRRNGESEDVGFLVGGVLSLCSAIAIALFFALPWRFHLACLVVLAVSLATQLLLSVSWGRRARSSRTNAPSPPP